LIPVHVSLLALHHTLLLNVEMLLRDASVDWAMHVVRSIAKQQGLAFASIKALE
jgi:hypothetical protein